MAVTVERTPNPAAMKFKVGTQVGGPATYRDAADAEPFVGEILEIEGVTSVFMTADFVTVTASPGFEWEPAILRITDILGAAFGD